MHIIVVFLEKKNSFVIEKKYDNTYFLWIVVTSQSDVNLDRWDLKWRNPWSREIDRIYAILSKNYEFQGMD
jgi:hypothetical protein